jgi:Fic family protein
MMANPVKWLNEKEIHPILVTGVAQFEFVHIHPFLYGNGRTLRLLWVLSTYEFKSRARDDNDAIRGSVRCR